MKKILSITLSVLMCALLLVPAAAASHTVTFVQPSAAYEGGYCFAKVEDGAVKYVEDPNGIFVYYSNRYLTLDDIYEDYWDQVPPERYSPDEYAGDLSFDDGETLTFAVVTSPEYNQSTVTVIVNHVVLEPGADGLYRVIVDRNLNISVLETDENGMTGLQKTLFNVKLVSGEGYALKPLKGESYKATPYGGDFNFRIKIKSGYTAASMKVGVIRDASIGDFAAEFDTLNNIINPDSLLTSTGIDEDGCRLYTLHNVTSECRVVVTGVREEKTSNVLTIFLRILRKILDFLGVKIQFVDDITNEYSVTVNNAASNVEYSFIAGGEAQLDGSYLVMAGSGATLQVIKHVEDQEVSVSWAPGNESGTYTTNWVGKRDPKTGHTVFIATYNIDNIKSDITVSIN